jgi:hypothetical protein
VTTLTYPVLQFRTSYQPNHRMGCLWVLRIRLWEGGA